MRREDFTKVTMDCGKVRSLLKVLDDKMCALNLSDTRKAIEDMDIMQDLVLVLMEQVDALCEETDELEHECFMKSDVA